MITEFDWKDWNELNNCIEDRKSRLSDSFFDKRITEEEYLKIKKNLEKLQEKVRWQLQKLGIKV